MKTKPGGKRIVYGRVVHNEAATPELTKNQLSHYTCNLSISGVKIRKETLAGRTYTVVPVVMMKEGVLNGSRGPLFYPGEELEKNPETWNHKPVLVCHPPDDSSACTPEILNAQQIGLLMNTRFDKKKRVVSEAYIDEELCKKVDNRVWTAIEKKQVLEQSTGLFTDNELTEGEFDGTEYSAIARNYRPDHLAVLPDQKGALSVERGGGFIRNELKALFPELDQDDAELLRSTVINVLKSEKHPGKTGLLIKMLTANEASHEEVRMQISTALQAKYPPPQGDSAGYSYPYVEAVYDGTCVFCLGGKLYSLGYTQSNAGVVKLDSTPREVVRVSEYRTKSGAVVNADPSQLKTNKEKTMDKKTMVSELISNHGYSEESRKTLMALDDKTVEVVYNNATAAAAAKAAPDDSDDGEVTDNDDPKAAKKAADAKKADADKKKKKTPAKNTDEGEEAAPTENSETTVEEYIEKAPAGVREMLKDGLMARNAERNALIKKITANKRNSFDKEELAAMQLNSLRKLASLADVTSNSEKDDRVVVSRYDGQAPVALLTANEAKEEDALPLPSWNDK